MKISPPRTALFSVAISGVIIALALLLSRHAESFVLPKISVLLVFQLALVMIALIATRVVTVMASVFCALCFNFFFTEPYYSFKMAYTEDIINLAVFLVISLLTRAFADAYQKQKAALELAQLRSTILLSISHDLRTPISSIIGSLSTFKNYRNKIPVSQQAALLDAAMEESYRLHRYIENILQATKLQFSPQLLQRRPVPVDGIVDAVVSRFETPRISVDNQAGEQYVLAQASLVEQALYNVIDNALIYSPPESLVCVDVVSQAGCTLITVRDEGPGIKEENASRVFELFHSNRQGDAGKGGVGLGLAVAKGIIEANQGEIRLLKSPVGCTIEITLENAEQQNG